MRIKAHTFSLLYGKDTTEKVTLKNKNPRLQTVLFYDVDRGIVLSV